VIDRLRAVLGWRDSGGADRVSIEELSGSELTRATEYLDAIDREATAEAIERTAGRLRSEASERTVSPFETREERSRLDRSLVAPSGSETKPSWHTRDGTFCRIFTATSLPRFVDPGWLVGLTLSPADVRVSVHATPRESGSVRGRLQKRLTQMQSAIQYKRRRGRTDTYEEEYERGELERLLRSVIAGTTRLFDVSVYVEVRADTKDDLEVVSDRVRQRMAERGLDLIPVEMRQDDAQGAVAPVARDPIRNTNAVQQEALATCFNAVEPAIVDPGGVLLGFDDTRRPVVMDRYALSGHSKAVTGKVGSGKSYATKMALYRRLLVDPDVRSIVFDPLGDDFVDFADAVDGTVIQFGGEHTVNPLDIAPGTTATQDEIDRYTVKVRSVLEIFKTYLDQRAGTSVAEEGVLTQAIHYAYLKKGITTDPGTFDRQSPTLDDVIDGVSTLADGGGGDGSFCHHSLPDPDEEVSERTIDRTTKVFADPSPRHVDVAKELLPKLESFTAGNVNANLNGQTNLDLDDRLVVFDMGSFADTGDLPLLMHVMLNWAYEEARRRPDRLDVTFEEAHYLLRRSGARDLLNLFIRHARHFDAGLTLVSQTAEEFLQNDSTREIYDNCDVKQLFYVEHVSDAVREYFSLADREVNFLTQAARGETAAFSECLLSTTEHGRRRLEVHSGPFEREVLSDDGDPQSWLEDHDSSADRTGPSPSPEDRSRRDNGPIDRGDRF
jgi:hypothetical protein